MSAETEIENLLNGAISKTNHFNSKSGSLISQAVALLAPPIKLPEVFGRIQAARLDTPTFPPFRPSRKGSKPGIPPPPDVELGKFPLKGEVDFLDAMFRGELPLLSLPTFYYNDPDNIPAFEARVPYIDASFITPKPPDVSPSYTKTRLGYQALLNDPLKPLEIQLKPGGTVQFDPQAFSVAFGSVLGDVETALGLNGARNGLSGDAENAHSGLTDEQRERFTRPQVSGYLASKVFAQQILDETKRVTDATQVNQSGWDIPAVVQQAMDRRVRQHIESWIAHVESQQNTHEWAQAVDMLQAAGDVYLSFFKLSYELRLKEMEVMLGKFRLVVVAAKKTVMALYQAYETEMYDVQEALLKQSEIELKSFDIKTRVGKVNYEFKKADIQREEEVQRLNEQEVKQFQADSQTIQQQTELVGALSKARSEELAANKIKLELFAAQIKAYDQQANSFVAQIDGKISQISGFEASVSGKLKQVEVFEAQVQAFNELIQAKTKATEIEKQKNEQELLRYQAEFKGKLATVEQSQLEAKYELAVYEASATDFVSSAGLVIAQSKAEAEFLEKESQAIMEAYRINQEQILDVANAKLEWLTTLADVNVDGAAIYARMSAAAMEAANGIANVIFQESA